MHRALDALPASSYLFCDDDDSASSVPKTATFGDLDEVLAVDHHGVKVEGFTDMEVTSDLRNVDVCVICGDWRRVGAAL